MRSIWVSGSEALGEPVGLSETERRRETGKENNKYARVHDTHSHGQIYMCVCVCLWMRVEVCVCVCACG